jgi:hypothetical protein
MSFDISPNPRSRIRAAPDSAVEPRLISTVRDVSGGPWRRALRGADVRDLRDTDQPSDELPPVHGGDVHVA